MAHQIIPFQRGSLEDTPALRRRMEEQFALLQRATAAGDAAERLRLLGSLGETYYLLGEHQEAFPLLEEALALARSLQDRRREVANLLRLATAQQYAGSHSQAERLFRQALDLADTSHQTEYIDFIWQHLGKCLMEQGRVDEAIGCFEEALARRQRKGDADLLASTERALAAARLKAPL